MRKTLIVAAAIALSACAMTYKGPVTTAHAVEQTAPGASREDVVRAAQKVAAREGYQILSADSSAGVVSIMSRAQKLSPEQADCGTTMGIDYLKDNRTETRVGYSIVADNERLTVQALIDGRYAPGAVDQNITLTCVSRGVLERDFAAKIASTAAQPSR